MIRVLLSLMALTLLAQLPSSAAGPADKRLRIATFEADVTPPLGTPLCDALVAPAKEIVDPLRARGIILLPAGQQPIVLCAVDWVGVGNSGHLAFRKALANAAGTTADRVAVHCLHQHDAPGCDFLADDILTPLGLGGKLFDPAFAKKAMHDVAVAVEKACKNPVPVSHVGIGKARVFDVASNRRVMGPDGKVKAVRYSATRDAAVRAEPEGVIDPFVQDLSFWDGDKALCSITYYATHPQSYYGKGSVNPDFPGLARRMRDIDEPGTFHIHFNGAGGNVTAGKYNDGNPANRAALAERLAKGMKEAFKATKKTPVQSGDVSWRVTAVSLPLSKQYNSRDLEAQIADRKLPERNRLIAARNLAWAQLCDKGTKIDLSCLKIGSTYVLHMPGELFVEYQLVAQKMKPDATVLMAAYGDYGPGYIGTAISYTQGGYETGPPSRVAPEVEEVLIGGMRQLLK